MILMNIMRYSMFLVKVTNFQLILPCQHIQQSRLNYNWPWTPTIARFLPSFMRNMKHGSRFYYPIRIYFILGECANVIFSHTSRSDRGKNAGMERAYNEDAALSVRLMAEGGWNFSFPFVAGVPLDASQRKENESRASERQRERRTINFYNLCSCVP